MLEQWQINLEVRKTMTEVVKQLELAAGEAGEGARLSPGTEAGPFVPISSIFSLFVDSQSRLRVRAALQHHAQGTTLRVPSTTLAGSRT